MKKEAALAAIAVGHLRADGWTVHEEVRIGRGDDRADIVAVREFPDRRLPIVRIIECKTSLTPDLVGQALQWRKQGAAHYVEVVVPAPGEGRRGKGYYFLKDALTQAGIGLLTVRCAPCAYWEVLSEADRAEEVAAGRVSPDGMIRRLHSDSQPRLNRPPSRGAGLVHWIEWLRSFHRSQERLARAAKHDGAPPAGSSAKGFWTPYQETVRRVQQVLGLRGPLTIPEILEVVAHHYGSDRIARSTLPSALRLYEQEWVVAERRGRVLYYRLRTPEDGDAAVVNGPEVPPDRPEVTGTGAVRSFRDDRALDLFA